MTVCVTVEAGRVARPGRLVPVPTTWRGARRPWARAGTYRARATSAVDVTKMVSVAVSALELVAMAVLMTVLSSKVVDTMVDVTSTSMKLVAICVTVTVTGAATACRAMLAALPRPARANAAVARLRIIFLAVIERLLPKKVGVEFRDARFRRAVR